jgi:Flp pilus assembly pilin Flp
MSSPDRRTRRAIRQRHPRPPVTRWRSRLRDDRGSATAEYAVVILAAVAFAGVLVAVMRSGEVQTLLTDLVRGALSL